MALDVAFLKDGKIALQGPLDELLEGARRVVGPSALLDNVRLAGEVRRRQDRGTTSVITRAGAGEMAALAERQPGLRIEALSLEDLFVEVTQ